MREDLVARVVFQVEDEAHVVEMYKYLPENLRFYSDTQIDTSEIDILHILMDCAFRIKWKGLLIAEYGYMLNHHLDWKDVYKVDWFWHEEGNE